MRGDRWLRSTPLRLLLGFSLLTVLTVLAAFLAAWVLIGGELRRLEDGRILETATSAEAVLHDVDLTDHAAVTNALESAVPDDGTLYQLTSPDGTTLASNTERVAIKETWSVLPPTVFNAGTDVPFRVFRKPVSGGDLLIARPQTARDEIDEVLFGAFGWAAALVLLAGIGEGAFLAGKAKLRLDAIAGALAEVGKGDLTVRIAQSGRQDDIDHLVERINQTIAQLEANVGTLRQMSVDIAHDLRTPLNRLHIRLEEAAQHLVAGRVPEAEIDDALAQSESLGAAFSALLRIAQIEAGARKKQFRSVDLAQVATEAAEAYDLVAEDSGMVLGLEAIGPVMINGDHELLVQAIVNLIENAICHCPPGTQIRLYAGANSGRAQISVADDGPGIPESEHGNVQKRHYRLERSRTTPGFGLGLSLVRAIADLHGAQMMLADTSPGLRVTLAFGRYPAA